MSELSRLKPKVLLVEDELIVQKVHRLMLEKMGCEVDIAMNGQEALLKAENCYDIIFMDIGLPDLTGVDVSREIRQREIKENHLSTPIIALTAYALEDLQDACKIAGINRLVAKPLKFTELKNLVLPYLNGASFMNHQQPQAISYRLYSQEKDDGIILQHLITGSYVFAQAAEILSNSELCHSLGLQDLRIIQFIAEQAREELKVMDHA